MIFSGGKVDDRPMFNRFLYRYLCDGQNFSACGKKNQQFLIYDARYFAESAVVAGCITLCSVALLCLRHQGGGIKRCEDIVNLQGAGHIVLLRAQRVELLISCSLQSIVALLVSSGSQSLLIWTMSGNRLSTTVEKATADQRVVGVRRTTVESTT